MARLASIQVAGYFPTPQELLPSFASLLRPEEVSYLPWVVVDPCAGDGDAIFGLRDHWAEAHVGGVKVIGNEMEKRRAESLKLSVDAGDVATHADAFNLEWVTGAAGGATVLWLNAPYDFDKEHKRLEQRFLARFTGMLKPGSGILLFLVPHAALAASASFLATEYLDHRCYRLPEGRFEAFKQVVLVARRAAAPLAGNAMEAAINGWAERPEDLPVLPEKDPTPSLVKKGSYGLRVEAHALDVGAAVRQFSPWAQAPVGLDRDVTELIGGELPVAMPPKPTHIALALSSGMFNGHRLEPNDPGKHPAILAKGCFERHLVELEKKRNEKGQVVASVQAETPRMKVVVLRLDTGVYQELAAGTMPTGSADLAEWNVADLIVNYDRALADLLLQQFPALHDPGDPEQQLVLPALARTPYRAQAQAVMASLKLLAQGQNPIVTAEVGTGKSTMALYIAGSLMEPYRGGVVGQLVEMGCPGRNLPRVRRILVVCPPHLLKSWTDQVAAVMPEARVQVLRTVGDLDREADVYILSREAAKLGHGIEGVSRCPGCGHAAGEPKANACKRARCGRITRRAANVWAMLAAKLAGALIEACPSSGLVRSCILGRMLESKLAELDPDEDEEPYERAAPVEPGPVRAKVAGDVLEELVRMLESPATEGETFEIAFETLPPLAVALGKEATVARRLTAAAALPSMPPGRSNRLRDAAARVTGRSWREESWRSEPASACLHALEGLHQRARYRERKACGEELYGAVPEPRRYPLSRRIARKYRSRFDLVVLDEAHEYSHTGSAQTKAAHRLTSLPGVPAVVLTGSLCGGYASSLFANFWQMSRSFQQEFRRGEMQGFTDRYGYKKVRISFDRPVDEVEYGSCTDREVSGSTKAVGEAPGVAPSFIMRHLLPIAAVVHKDDLDIELPAITETPVALQDEVELCAADHEMLGSYSEIQKELLAQIKADRFTKLSGKLLGALVEMPSYLDLCSEECGTFQLRYPESCGGTVVVTGKAFPKGYVTPKERYLLAKVKELLATGERVLVFLRHTGKNALPLRLMRLLRGVTPKVAWLDTGKVPTAKREAWIDSQVEADVKVLIVNPNAVRTGLNNLVAYSTAIWYELDWSAYTYRQANGRLHRIGQLRPVTVLLPYYAETAQEVGVDLVARKVTASLQVDGLDLRAALEAAGAGEDTGAAMAMSIGQMVWRALTEAAAVA